VRRYRQDGAEEHSFDHLARGLASGSVSRKQALKLVGGALLGGVLTSLPGVAWAVPKSDKQPPGQSPPPPPPPPTESPPPPPPGCAEDQDDCNGTCVDVLTDVKNCGYCQHTCPAGYSCVDGLCEPCPAGQILCDSGCVDPSTDNYNCGGCGTRCIFSVCCGGVCCFYGCLDPATQTCKPSPV